MNCAVSSCSNNRVVQLVPQLRKLLFAFNCSFEKGLLFHSCGIILDFDGELNQEMYEGKGDAIAKLEFDRSIDRSVDRIITAS